MADAPAAANQPEGKFSTPELHILITGADGAVQIKDKKDQFHTLCPLTMSDIVEYEEKFGKSILDIHSGLRFKEIMYMVYMSLRKEGLSVGDIESRRFKHTVQQVQDMFDLKFLTATAQVVLDILRVSGFTLKPEGSPENPSQTPPPANSGGAGQSQ